MAAGSPSTKPGPRTPGGGGRRRSSRRRRRAVAGGSYRGGGGIRRRLLTLMHQSEIENEPESRSQRHCSSGSNGCSTNMSARIYGPTGATSSLVGIDAGQHRSGAADRSLPGVFFVGRDPEHAGRGRRSKPRFRRFASSRPSLDCDPGRSARRAELALAARGLRARSFLRHKCGYCDFASLAGVDHLADRYLAALEREIETAARRTPGGRHDLRRWWHADAARCRSVVPADRDHQPLVHLDARAASGPSRPIPAPSTPRRPTSWPQPA